jgi:hypothetical protein
MIGQKSRDASIPVVVPVKIAIRIGADDFLPTASRIFLESLASFGILNVKVDYCFAVSKNRCLLA